MAGWPKPTMPSTIPFFLDGVAGQRDLNLDDGIHPTAEGIALIVERIMPYVEDLLSRVAATIRPAAKSPIF
jgi:lysophospholipase L1-like esterase